MTTLRSYRQFDFFKIQFSEAIEKSANSTFCFIMVHRWIGFRLDMLCVLFGVSVTAFAIFLKDVLDKEMLVFSLQIITDVILYFSISIRMLAEIQNHMTCS